MRLYHVYHLIDSIQACLPCVVCGKEPVRVCSPVLMAAGHGKSHLLWQLACMRVPAPAVPGMPGHRRHNSWRASDACSCHAHGATGTEARQGISWPVQADKRSICGNGKLSRVQLRMHAVFHWMLQLVARL